MISILNMNWKGKIIKTLKSKYIPMVIIANRYYSFTHFTIVFISKSYEPENKIYNSDRF